jgi:copper homeostasis protein
VRLLEVIVTGPEEARIAAAGGANRVELVAERDRGGLTPDVSTVKAVLGAVAIPVHVMARPHDRGFTYHGSDRAALLRDVSRVAALKPAAIVAGALDDRRRINVSLLRDILDAADGLPITFHRAFDELADLNAGFDVLAAFAQVTRVLTSGGAANAWSGRSVLASLIAKGSGPIVLPGAGINERNVRELLAATKAREIHVGDGARRQGRLDRERVASLKRAIATE